MRTLAIVCLSFGFAAVAAAQCRPPKYEQSERWADNHPTIYIGTISMAPRDFGPVQLVCLAAALHEKYKNREEVFIYIFSSKKASRAPIAFQEIDQEIIDASLQLHAFYLWNRDSHEEYITLLPAGINPPSMGKTEGDLSTRIDLPVAAPPRCKVEVQRRCLLGIPSKYSMDVGRETGSGSVSLIGTATPDGRIQDVRVLGGSNLFAAAAVRDFSAWRIEPGTKEPIQVIYSFTVDATLRDTYVTWNPPNHMDIKTGPQEIARNLGARGAPDISARAGGSGWT